MCDFPPFVLQSNGRTLALVVDFEVIPNSYPVKAKPKDDYDGEDPLPTAPWLDVQVCNCNCSSYPNRGDVLVNTSATHESHNYTESSDDCQSSEESVSDGNIDLRNEDFKENDNCDDDDDNDDDDDDDSDQGDHLPEKFTEYFALKGSSYHEDCQKALRKCKQLQLAKQQIELRVMPEPTNIRDKNAIVVEVQLDGEWCRIGYIQKEKIRKVTAAIKKNEIEKVEFKSIGFMFIPDLNDWLYQPRVLITKSHHWLPTDVNYRYNDNLE